jgi:hypothetical protein
MRNDCVIHCVNDCVRWLHMLATVGSQLRHVIWISIYSVVSSHRNSSCFTRKTPSHPAHASNLGKVGSVPYKVV